MQARYRLVAFDAYGTLCFIGNKLNPYGPVIAQSGLDYREAASVLMTSTDSLVSLFDVDESLIQEVNAKVEEELASVCPFEESIKTLQELKNRGVKVAVVSNLSPPYAAPLKELFSQYVDYFVFSFEVGHRKPDPKIFTELMLVSGCRADEIMMVGDSIVSDVGGAKSVGISSVLVKRKGNTQDGEVCTLDEINRYIFE